MASTRRRSSEAISTSKPAGEHDLSAGSGLPLHIGQIGLGTSFERISDGGEEGEDGLVVAVEDEEEFIDMERI